MLHALANRWWVFLLRGLVAIAAGVITMMHPELTLLVLIVLIGVSALVDGLACVFAGVGGGAAGRPWWEMILLGLAGVGFGIATLAWPGLTTMFLVFLIASWSIVRGIFEIAVAVKLRKEIDDEWLIGLSGVISIAFGALLFAKPGAGALALATIIGFFLFIGGAMAVAFALRLRSLKSKLQATR